MRDVTARRRVESLFRDRFGRPPEILVRAPGRLNLVGAHVDVHEGWVLPGAVDRAIWLAAARAAGPIHLVAADLGEEVVLDPGALPPPVGERDRGSAAWSDLPAGVAAELRAADLPVTGLDAVFGGDLPPGAGMSSSAAVEMAFVLAWEALGGFMLTDVERARLGRRVENGYLGVGSGIMDQMACLHGREDHLLLLDCRTLGIEEIPLPRPAALLVLDSGVRRRLAASGFDDRHASCRVALDALRDLVPGISTLRDLSPELFERHAARLPEIPRRRARHVVRECRRVLDCAEALRRGDLVRAGRLVVDSHDGSSRLFEVSLPELDLLAEVAAETPGCWGARLSGGGFGGCVVALVDAERAEAVRLTVQRAFAERFGRVPPAFLCRVANGAERM